MANVNAFAASGLTSLTEPGLVLGSCSGVHAKACMLTADKVPGHAEDHLISFTEASSMIVQRPFDPFGHFSRAMEEPDTNV